MATNNNKTIPDILEEMANDVEQFLSCWERFKEGGQR